MDVLDRLDRLQHLWQGTSITLNPPATPAQLEAAEAAMGVQLPDDVRRAYLRFNGTSRRPFDENCPSGPVLFFLSSWDWVTLDLMVELWTQMHDISAMLIRQGSWPDITSNSESVWGTPEDRACRRAEFVGWLPRWLPIGDCGHALSTVYLDLAPTELGVHGQILRTEESALEVEVVANSFSEYLESFVTGVETGRLYFRKGDPSWYSPGRSDPVWQLWEVGLGPKIPVLAPPTPDSTAIPPGITISGMPAVETSWKGQPTYQLPLTTRRGPDEPGD